MSAPFDINGLRHYPHHHIARWYPVLAPDIGSIHHWLNQQGIGGGADIWSLKNRMDALWSALHVPPDSGGGDGGGCSGTCVLIGTLVDMADGSTKPVETLTAGDRLADGIGGVSTVAALVEVPLANRPLIRLGTVGMTPDHPVLIGGAWQVADLAAMARHLPATVNGITGDYNAAQRAAGQLAGFTTESLPPDTRMFSPILSVGESFAAGGLVHGGLQVV